MAKNNEKKTVGIIIAFAVAILVAVIIFSISIVKAIKKETNNNTTEYTLQGDQPSTEYNDTVIDNIVVSTDVLVPSGSDTSNVSSSETGVATTNSNNTSTTKEPEKVTSAETTEYDPIAAYEKLEKQGEAYASNDPNNKHIRKIADKYGVDPALLVVLYSERESGENLGTNFILEFDGSKDKSGNYIKSPDTLKKVYHIDKEGDISVTQGKMTGNIGVSYADGMLVFNMVKTILMPKYPDYFTGV